MLADDTRKSLYVRAQFGLPVKESPEWVVGRLRTLAEAGERLAAELRPGGVALITGPSGSGKSLTLRAFAAVAGALTVSPVSSAAKKPPVSMLRGDLDTVLAVLAATGLGEARRLVTPAGQLSEGERSRLALARAIAHARTVRAARDIVCDEFTSTLDRLTARSVCRCVRRALGPTQRLVCATAHDDVTPHLDPDVVVYVPLAGPPECIRREDERADSASSSVA